MRYKLFITISYILSDSIKNILTRYLFSISSIPDLIEKLYLQLFIFLMSQLTYLLNEDKSFQTIEIIVGLIYSASCLNQFEMIQAFGFAYSFALGLVIELFGIVLISFISEVLSGRKLKTERNTILVVVFAIFGAALSMPNNFKTNSLFILGTILFLKFAMYNICKHVFAASTDLRKVMLISSSLSLAKNAFFLSSHNILQVIKINQDILKYKEMSIFLFIIAIIHYLLDLYVFKHFDIDYVFLLKSTSMLIYLSYETLDLKK